MLQRKNPSSRRARARFLILSHLLSHVRMNDETFLVLRNIFHQGLF